MTLLATEKYLYAAICFFAFALNVSVAGTSIAMALGAILLLYKGFRYGEWPKLESSWVKVIIAYEVLELIVALSSSSPKTSLNVVLTVFTRIIIILLPLCAIRTKEHLRGFFIAFLTSLSVANLYSLYQFVFVAGKQPTGFMPLTTIYGAQLVLVLGILFMAWFEKSAKNLRMVILPNILAVMCILVASGARGALLGALMTILLLPIVVPEYRKQMIATLLVGFTFFGAAVFVFNPYNLKDRMMSLSSPTQESSANERLYMWKGAYRIWFDYPLLGVGQGEYGTYYKDYKYRDAKAQYYSQPHSNIMKALAEGGIFSVIAYFLLYGFVLYWLFKEYKQNGNNLALMAFLMTIAFHLDGLTETMNAQNSRIFWLAIGTVLASKAIEGKKSRFK